MSAMMTAVVGPSHLPTDLEAILTREIEIQQYGIWQQRANASDDPISVQVMLNAKAVRG
jgi:hypothetical protein